MKRFFMMTTILAIVGCSGSEQGGRQGNKTDQAGQADGEKSGNADLAKRIVGKWKMADGSDYVLEFTLDGMLSVKNKAGERQVRVPGNNPPDLRYTFISKTDVKAEFTDGHFAFSVRIDADKLTIRGKKGGDPISIFPGSEAESLEFVRQK